MNPIASLRKTPILILSSITGAFLCLVLISPLGAEIAFENVTVNGQPVAHLTSVKLSDRDLTNGAIEIAGQTSGTKLEFSFDAGRTWQTTDVTNGSFKIVLEPKDESRDFTVLMRSDSGSENFAVILQYRSRRMIESFETLFHEIRDVYLDERLYPFLEYFERERYDNFVQFEENMENTFDFNGNINLHILVGSVQVKDDVALVRVDWRRTWDDASSARGSNNIIRFRRVDGRWLITDIEDEGIFIIGNGTFRGNVSDR